MVGAETPVEAHEGSLPGRPVGAQDALDLPFTVSLRTSQEEEVVLPG
jgi:hypothetical protein